MSELDRRPRVYGASKLAHAGEWRQARASFPEICWTARWPDIEGQVSDSEVNARSFWLHDIQDVQKADFVIVLAPALDAHLRGALVEAGAALSLGKHVVLVGDHPDWGTWRWHPMVTCVPSLEAACRFVCGEWQ